METWKELISKRKPKGIADLEEDIKPEDKEILDKLKSIRITIDMQNAPLTAMTGMALLVLFIAEIATVLMGVRSVRRRPGQAIFASAGRLIFRQSPGP